MQNNLPPLPIDELIPSIIENLKSSSSLILQATPGAGKTTRVPPALMEIFEGKILVLEPRRLATKLSAERVAQELNEKCGERIGYQVRFDKLESGKTKVKYITEGIFSRLVLSDPTLSEISCVIIDEFHERHIHTDIALMLVKLLQNTIRPDLKLIVMSATLETKNLQTYLPQAKVFLSEGKAYPVTFEYAKNDELKKQLPFQITEAVENLMKNSLCPGHILVFLPGIQEIRKCADALKHLNNNNCEIFQLKADLPIQEQQKIFSQTQKRKIILSTNVAETSVTIDGVTGVIDSGVAKIAGHASWSGLPTLDTLPISQASCIQRAGRAGRTQPGIAKRLYTQLDFNMRAAFQKPEIQRVDLSQALLELKIMEQNLKSHFIHKNYNSTNNDFFPWFEKPPQNILQSCSNLLRYLGAFDENSNITECGIEMAKYPLHPRLSRILIESKKRNSLAQGILIVSFINEGMFMRRGIDAPDIAHSDIAYQLELFKMVHTKVELSHFKKDLIDMAAFKRIETLARQLCSLHSVPFHICLEPLSEETLSLILLSGYSDRVCQIRNQSKKNISGRRELNLCLGGGALLSPTSVVQDSEFLLAIDAEESATALSQSHSTQIRICHGIEKDLLIAAPDGFIQDAEEYFWDNEQERVRGLQKILYGKVILEEQQIREQNSQFENILIKQVMSSWPKPFDDDKALQYLGTRTLLAKKAGCILNIPNFTGEDFELLLCHICEGKKSFDEILEKELDDYIEELLNYEDKKTLSDLFPSSITIGKGRKVKVNYEEEKPPWVASRLQDFFGTVQTPKICKGTIPLVVHLLAPNMQSVQVTTDLAGFWERGYLEVKKELSRKYPRHSWPDDPKTAEPPEYIAKRRRKS
ncbi:ATP-dependent helicase HrpB [Silvanigrella aquatica]|uniref:ATP-dependent helicase HrpB n=1 Tax=Silvanigrella aquatica TaxID=1915309 RepID=A0A1L4CYQ8_9BACT|nr:ATP-dependent helicase HrpB [Silvanigrella aquatica]APJ03070.1 ATP-dependent helicase HrpB [Silvanigrella aquatica]